MNANTPPTPAYGEPWMPIQPDLIYDSGSRHWMADAHNPQVRDRIIACVNACAGMVNPAEEIASLKSERDEAIAKLSTVFQWINRNHPDGFVDSLTHLENLERISDDHHETVDGLERDCKAMREAIREAYNATKSASTVIGTTPRQDQALAKLQPFINP